MCRGIMDMIDLHPSLAEAPIGHKGRVNDSWSDIPESLKTQKVSR